MQNIRKVGTMFRFYGKRWENLCEFRKILSMLSNRWYITGKVRFFCFFFCFFFQITYLLCFPQCEKILKKFEKEFENFFSQNLYKIRKLGENIEKILKIWEKFWSKNSRSSIIEIFVKRLGKCVIHIIY